MSRSDVLRRAQEAVLGPVLKDFAEGKIGAEDVEQMAERRAEQIRSTVRELERGPQKAPRCAEPGCRSPSTTVKAGTAFCDAHAALHTQRMNG